MTPPSGRSRPSARPVITALPITPSPSRARTLTLRHSLDTNPGRRSRGTPHMRFIVSWHTRATFVAPHSVTSSATRTATGLPVIGCDALADVLADERELGPDGVEDLVQQRRVVLEHDRQHGHGHEQQRDQREEAVVGDDRAEPPAVVLAVPLE